MRRRQPQQRRQRRQQKQRRWRRRGWRRRGWRLPAEYTLPFADIEWEKDEDDEKVELGRGAFGTVYAGRLHGQAVAIKHEAIDDAEDSAAWTKTVVLHMRARCPHIATMIGAAVRAPKAGSKTVHYVVMERLAGTLTALVLKPGGAHYDADTELRLALLADVAGGLAYLHAASVIHADVKPDNVLLTVPTRRAPLPTAKLADFGSSVQRYAGSRTRGTLVGERGTLVYMDPVLLDRSASITAASDVYSFGVMAWQVLTGLQPYEAELMEAAPASALDAEKLLKAHVCGPRGKRPPVAALVKLDVPADIVTLVQACWAPTQASRPAMAEVHRALEATAVAAAAVAELGASGSGGEGGRGSFYAPTPTSTSPAALQTGFAAAPLSAATLAAGRGRAPSFASAPSPVTTVAPAPLAYEWDTKLVLRGHTNTFYSLALLPGGRLATGDVSGTVRLWDAARGGKATAVMKGHGGIVFALAALLDGRRLAAGVCADGGKAGAIVVWDTGVAPPTRCTTVECGSGVWTAGVLHGGCLAAGCHDGGIRLVEMVGVSAGAVAATLEGHTGVVAALAVLPDGTLASGSYDGTVRLWDVGTRECVTTLAGHKYHVNALAVLADGRLASGSDDKSVRLWDVDTRACIGVLEGHTRAVWALSALPDGRLASASWDRTIRVWDTRPVDAGAGADTAGIVVATGDGAACATPVVVLEGHTREVFALQPLPGGRLASGSGDCTVRLWHLPP